MAAFTRDITVNLIPGGFDPVITINQYDAGMVEYQFTIMEGNAAAQFPEGTTVKFLGRKPSSLGFSEDGTLSGNVATIEISATMTEESGKVPAELAFFNGEDRINSANVLMLVEASAHPAGTLDADTETAQTLVEQMQAAVLAAQTAAASVNPQIITSAETEPTLEADGRYIYVFSNPLTALDLTPAANGVTSVFFSSASGTCSLTLPASVIIPPGLNVVSDSSGHAVELPGGLKYEINIFENHMLIEAWE